MRADVVEVSVEAGQTRAKWRAGGSTQACKLHPGCSTNGSAGLVSPNKFAPAATGCVRAPRRKDLLRMLVRGDESLATVKLIEGWTFKRFRQELAAADGLKQTIPLW